MLFNELKLAFQSFKRSWADYLAISFVFAMIVYIGLLIGQSIIGLLLAFIIVVIPAIISLKFCAYQAYDKPQVEYRSLKIGFLTFFKSIRVYFVVILKPILIGFLIGMIAYSFFLEPAIRIASKSIPGLMDSLGNYDTFAYAYEDMMKIEKVSNLMNIGMIVSVSIGYLVYFCLKLKRDFIPFVAFEMPINSKRAVVMNGKILEKKRYAKFLIINLLILAMCVVPAAIAYLMRIGLETNEVLSPNTIDLLTILVFVILVSPIITLKQLHYVYAYKSYSKPFKEDFNNELKNVIKEMEELAKKINEKDEK